MHDVDDDSLSSALLETETSLSFDAACCRAVDHQ